LEKSLEDQQDLVGGNKKQKKQALVQAETKVDSNGKGPSQDDIGAAVEAYI